jgi:uracil-DNA glycosylase
MTKLNKDKFAPLFGDWWDKIEPFFDEGGLDPIYEQLKKESTMGKKIAPISSNVYRCFQATPLKDLKVVLMGMCPYHSSFEGSPVADGLLMGCSITNKLQPSLSKFYDAIERDVYNGLSLDGDKNPDVGFLAAQGVLMLNAALTTQIGVAGSHIKLWEPFTTYMFEKVFIVENVPIIFLGKDAAVYKQYCNGHVFVLSHPASASYKNEEWDTNGVFKQVTEIVKGQIDYTIDWLDFDPPF